MRDPAYLEVDQLGACLCFKPAFSIRACERQQAIWNELLKLGVHS